jgi:hypothetical protein
MTDRPRRTTFRRVERWLVGLVMAVIAFVLERAVLRSIKRGGTEPGPEQPSPAHAVKLGTDEVSADDR